MKTLKEYILITLGMLVLAAGLYFFLIPANIAAGGAMGIAIIINHYFPILGVGQLMMVINIILFLIAFIVLGTNFGIKTIYASLGVSASIWVLELLFPLQGPLTDDMLLTTILGVAISGAGMGIIFNQGASSGGTDIIAKIINKYTHLDIGKALLLSDAVITLFAASIFGFEQGMYALLAVIFNGSVVDYTIQGLNVAMQVLIVSSAPDEIASFILEDLGRGLTFLKGQGGYSGQERKVIYTVVSRREFVALRSFIQEKDPRAFISVSQAHEVLGKVSRLWLQNSQLGKISKWNVAVKYDFKRMEPIFSSKRY